MVVHGHPERLASHMLHNSHPRDHAIPKCNRLLFIVDQNYRCVVPAADGRILWILYSKMHDPFKILLIGFR